MDHHQDILAQLAELKKWHEDHCGDGVVDNSSSVLSPEDQAKIYKMLGLSPSFINEIETSQTSATHPDEALNNSVSPRTEDNGSTTALKCVKITNDLSGAAESSVPVIKRPFLRRGEGLTNRFKIPPDRYNLQNLPRYKFAVTKPLIDKKRLTSEPELPLGPKRK